MGGLKNSKEHLIDIGKLGGLSNSSEQQSLKGKKGSIKSAEVRFEGSNEQLKPWETLGISRRTYYYRQSKGLIWFLFLHLYKQQPNQILAKRKN